MRSFNFFFRTLFLCFGMATTGLLFGQAPLALTFSGVNPTCHNFTNGIATVAVTGGSGTYYYSWNNGQGGSSNLGLTAGTYYVTVTDAISGVVATGSTSLTHPPQIVVTINPINANCGGFNGNLSSVVVGGTPGYTYAWSNGANTPSQSNLGNASGGYFLTVTDAQNCADVDFVHIYPAPNMVASYTVNMPLCAGQANGSINNVNIVGNYGPWQYSWPNSQVNQPLTGITAGNYTVTLSDVNGCTTTQTAQVQDHAPLTLTMSKEDSKCAMTCDGVAKVYPTGGVAPYQILWSNGSTNMVNFPLPLGTFTVTVTDANGCAKQDSVQITEPSLIEVTIVSVVGACGTSTGSASVNATGGVPPYVYVWSNGTNGSSINNVSPGNYSVEITDANLCKKTKAVVIPSSGTMTANVVVGSSICAGQSTGTASVQVFGGQAPYSYAWNVQSINAPNINGLAGGQTVTVTVSDAAGCQVTASGYISVHQTIFLGVTATNVTCATDVNGSAIANASNGAAPYTYTWNSPNGPVTGPNLAGLGVGSYAVTTTDANGCTAANVANITNTDQVAAAYQLAVNGCAPNVTTTLTDASSGATSWAWSVFSNNGPSTYNVQNPGNINLPNGTNGTIQLSVTSANGCIANTSQAFLVNGESVDVSLSTNQVQACENVAQSITATNLDPTNPVTLSWYATPAGLTISNPTAAATSINGPAGNYTLFVIATGANGCKDTLSAAVNYSNGQPLPAGAIGADLCNGLAVDFDNATTLPGVWTFGDGTTSTLNDPAHTYAQAGNYTVTFTPTGACVAPFDTVITVLAAQAVNAGFQHAIVSCDSVAIFNFVNTSSPSTGLTYSWNLGQGNVSTLPNPTATYNGLGPVTAILTATNANGCIDTANVTFPFHIIDEDIAPSQSFCQGAVALGLNPGPNNPNYDYKWSATPADPNLNTTAANPTVLPTVTTTYTVTVTWGGCQVQETVTITPNQAAQLTAPANLNSCGTGDTTLVASSTNGTIIWSTSPAFTNPVTGNTYTVTQPASGNLYIQATTAAGCTSQATITVQVQPVNISYNTGNPINVCAGTSTDELEITNDDSNDNLTYAWSGGLPAVSNPTVTPTANTSYTVTVTNQYNCTATASFNLASVQVAVSIVNNGKATICPGETTELEAVHGPGTFSYEWSPSFGGLIVSGQTEQIATVRPPTTQIYTVTITDANMCTATATNKVDLLSLTCSRPYVFLPSAFTPNDDTENDRIMVRGIHIEELTFVIFDRWGERMFETKTITDAGWDGSFRGTRLSPDSYGYYFQVKCTGGETYEEKGNITLLK
jgi:large repetitive protein